MNQHSESKFITKVMCRVLSVANLEIYMYIQNILTCYLEKTNYLVIQTYYFLDITLLLIDPLFFKCIT